MTTITSSSRTSQGNPILSALRDDITFFATSGKKDEWYDQYLSDDFTGEAWDDTDISPEDISFARKVIHALRHRFRVTEMVLHAVRESNGNILVVTSDRTEAWNAASQEGDTIESFTVTLPIHSGVLR